jgi:hypothetical protein
MYDITHLMAKIDCTREKNAVFMLLVFQFAHPLDTHVQIFPAMVDVTNDDTSDIMVLQE